MECKICGNKDKNYFAYFNNDIYCRKCILYKNKDTVSKKIFNENTYKAEIDYKLTVTQEKASNEILKYVKKKENVIVNAVCGAGKTELVYKSLEFFLNQGKRVAFAIPRKDVVIEIYNRLKKDYPYIKTCAIYGGNINMLDSQLIILTTHQLYRYPNYFDLLILDEADAFPYYKNELLEIFLKKAVNGPIIFLSATMKEEYYKLCKNVVLVNRRYHNIDLPIPKYIKYNSLNKLIILKQKLKTINKPCLIFVPTIIIGLYLQKSLNIPFVYSSLKEKEMIIQKFKDNEINTLITTSILERGITILGLQVIVFEADHKLFDDSTLIQISGRVGRKIKSPNGTILFLARTKSEMMKKCIKTLKTKNQIAA